MTIYEESIRVQVSDEYQAMGVRIKAYRILNSLTQKELGEKIGCHAKVISRIESGKAKINLNYIKPLAKVFQIDINSLFSDTIPI